MSKKVSTEELDAVVDALLLPDKKKKKGQENYTPEPKTGISWSDRQRKYFLMTSGYDPCEGKPPKKITVRAGESEISLTLPEMAEGYEEEFRKLLKITLKFICQQNAFGPCHPSNLKQLGWVLDRADVD